MLLIKYVINDSVEIHGKHNKFAVNHNIHRFYETEDITFDDIDLMN